MKRFFSGIGTFLHMVWLWFALLLLIIPQCAYAQVYELACCHMEDGKKIESRATAVCIGNSESGKSLLLTARHAVDEPNPSVWVAYDSKWIEVTRVVMHDTEDLAAIECRAKLPGYALGDTTPVEREVEVSGFGPQFAATGDKFSFRGQINESGELRGIDGSHIMPGDSGGPVIVPTDEGKALVGIVIDHEGSTPASSRRAFAAKRIRTGFVPAETICAFIQTQYGGCPNGLCPIRIRPAVRQPVIGIGFPIGPPQVVHEAVPVPRPDPVYVPQQQTEPQVIQGQQGPRGPAGPQGPRGEPGMSITQEQVEATVNAWLDSNREQLRGPAGRDGVDGKPGQSFSREDLSAAVAAWLEANRLDLRSPPPTDTQVVKATEQILFADPERFRGPPGRDGANGTAGPKGDRYVAVPDDEAFREHVERWLTANPQYKDLPELSQRISEVEAVLAKKQPVRILNSDGSLFSEDTERGILDPIVIRLEEPK